MGTYAPVWFLLLMIAVDDVKEHRIPNRLLLLATFFLLVDALASYSSSLEYVHAFAGGIALFAAGLVLFLVKAMSPGDVKLLFVVGVFVGWGELTEACLYITLAGGLVGLFYLFFNASLNSEGFYGLTKKYLFNRFMWLQGIRVNPQLTDGYCHSRYQAKFTMPFAPSVVIGLAMFSYFQ